jgi:hypothetical protein
MSGGNGQPAPDPADVAYIRSLLDLERGGARTTLVIGPYTGFIMIASLQLASRHPSMAGTRKATLDSFIAQAMTMFAGTPGEALLARGNDPSQDVPPDPR